MHIITLLLLALLSIILLKIEEFITLKKHKISTYIRTYIITAAVLSSVYLLDVPTIMKDFTNVQYAQSIPNVNEPILKEDQL